MCSIKNTFYTTSIYVDLESTQSKAVPATSFKTGRGGGTTQTVYWSPLRYFLWF